MMKVFYYIRNDIEHIRDDLALMISGEGIDARVEEFAASAMDLRTKNQIYSAMVVYGLLTYTKGKVFIPNRELMFKYEELLRSEKSLGYVYRLANISDQMLKRNPFLVTQTGWLRSCSWHTIQKHRFFRIITKRNWLR